MFLCKASLLQIFIKGLSKESFPRDFKAFYFFGSVINNFKSNYKLTNSKWPSGLNSSRQVTEVKLG